MLGFFVFRVVGFFFFPLDLSQFDDLKRRKKMLNLKAGQVNRTEVGYYYSNNT